MVDEGVIRAIVTLFKTEECPRCHTIVLAVQISDVRGKKYCNKCLHDLIRDFAEENRRRIKHIYEKIISIEWVEPEEKPPMPVDEIKWKR